MSFSQTDLDICLRVLQQIADDPAMMQEHERFKALIAKIHKTGKKAERRGTRQQRRDDDRASVQATDLVRRQLGRPPALPAPSGAGARHRSRPRRCYSCKQIFSDLHFFYHMLCPDCAALNYQKREQRADLRGRVALLTGGRIKIGYQIALRMLRDGARVIVTTRFPQDAARRFAGEADFASWGARLAIYGLDLRHIPSVEAFAAQLCASEPQLDILINNAAQTIKRPLEFYRHLIEQEQTSGAAQAQLAAGGGAALIERLPEYRGHLADTSAYFPSNSFDSDGQQLDTRPSNSWVLRLDQVSTVELLEVQLVNAVAPFILAGQLKPLLLRSPHARRFIVNVSAMEGQFARSEKTVFHPHTNMAKAALNMLTRTSAADYARDGIFMNSVDTGWITDEKPHEQRLNVRRMHGFYTPLDVIDGMARIYDPIARGLNEDAEPLHGHFLKDYRPYAW